MAGHNNVEFAGLTDVGVRRSHNQDSYAILAAPDKEQWRSRGHIFLVADGMGAHAVGELASKMAADSIPHIYSKHAHEGPAAALRRAFIEANSTIHNRGQQNREFEGMGTTSTALLLRPEGAWVCHVGDSRVYRIRNGQVEQLSFDHSLVWEMARRQNCKPEELPGIPPNVIVRSLGPEPLVQIDIEGPHPVEPGDIYVVCSDGLSGPLSDQEIGAVASVMPPEESCPLLVDLANLHGGPDNITAIVVRIDESESTDSDYSGSWIGTLFPQRGTAWYDRIPWPLMSSLFGIGLAVVAILLTIYQLPGNFAAFIFAALALMVGLGGIMYQFRRESHRREEAVPATSIHVYRKSPCKVEKTLVEKMIHAQNVLSERIKEYGWTADWEACAEHQLRYQEHVKNDRPLDAFREACRGLRILTEAIHRQRSRSELFKPLWDQRADVTS